MDNYKHINKQLIDANRELKKTCAAYERELVELRVKFMEEHRLRVEFERDLRERFVMVLAQNFRTALEEIDPNLGILEALGFGNASLDGSNRNALSKSSRHSIDCTNDRRCSEIVQEFRRSSSFHQRSSLQSSPTRLSEAFSSESLQDAETLDAGKSYSPKSNQEVAVDADVHLNKITEDDENVSDEGLLSASLCSLQISQKDVDDIVLGDQVQRFSNQDENAHKPHIVTTRGRVIRKHNFHNDSENSIECVRSSNDRTITSPTYANAADNNTIKGSDDSVNRFPSLPLSEISIKNFNEAPCSTPRDMVPLRSESFSGQTMPYRRENKISSNSLTAGEMCHSTRPSRTCAPKSFVEPGLREKLRNNNTTTKRRKKK